MGVHSPSTSTSLLHICCSTPSHPKACDSFCILLVSACRVPRAACCFWGRREKKRGISRGRNTRGSLGGTRNRPGNEVPGYQGNRQPEPNPILCSPISTLLSSSFLGSRSGNHLSFPTAAPLCSYLLYSFMFSQSARLLSNFICHFCFTFAQKSAFIIPIPSVSGTGDHVGNM